MSPYPLGITAAAPEDASRTLMSPSSPHGSEDHSVRGGFNYLFFLNQKVESGIDFDLKIADRFLYQNRIAIDPDNFLIAIIGAIAI